MICPACNHANTRSTMATIMEEHWCPECGAMIQKLNGRVYHNVPEMVKKTLEMRKKHARWKQSRKQSSTRTSHGSARRAATKTKASRKSKRRSGSSRRGK